MLHWAQIGGLEKVAFGLLGALGVEGVLPQARNPQTPNLKAPEFGVLGSGIEGVVDAEFCVQMFRVEGSGLESAEFRV